MTTASLAELQEHYGVREWGLHATQAIRLLRNARDEEGCWMWTAWCKPKGYGRIDWRGYGRSAHRVSYEFFVGPIPEGMHLDHLCRRTGCIRPDHLEPVTAAENNRRSREARKAVAA